jgi:hypothetical protein
MTVQALEDMDKLRTAEVELSAQKMTRQRKKTLLVIQNEANAKAEENGMVQVVF